MFSVLGLRFPVFSRRRFHALREATVIYRRTLMGQSPDFEENDEGLATPYPFGQWMAAQRGGRSISYYARKANISWQRWNKLEKGISNRQDGGPPELERKTVIKIADALGRPHNEAFQAADMPPEYNFGGDTPPAILAYYNEAPPEVQDEMVDHVETIYMRWRRKQTTHGKKAEIDSEDELTH